MMLAGAPTPARAADPYPGYESAIYGDPAHWLCRPDTDDVCDHDLDATVVKANGKTRVRALARGAQAEDRLLLRLSRPSRPIRRATATSSPATTRSSSSSASRRRASASVCRVFAPVYRQVTLTALLGVLGGNPIPIDRGARLRRRRSTPGSTTSPTTTSGRGVVLIGHSQGAAVLIAPHPGARSTRIPCCATAWCRRCCSAPASRCRSAPTSAATSRTSRSAQPPRPGCAITYGSFRATAPPPANSLFGVVAPGRLEGCVHQPGLARRAAAARCTRTCPTDGPLAADPPGRRRRRGSTRRAASRSPRRSSRCPASSRPGAPSTTASSTSRSR